VLILPKIQGPNYKMRITNDHVIVWVTLINQSRAQPTSIKEGFAGHIRFLLHILLVFIILVF
jgi:hypothetical protein